MANGLDAVGEALASRQTQVPIQSQPQAQDPTAELQGIIDTHQSTLEGLESEVTQMAMVLQEVIGAYTEIAQMMQAVMYAMQGGQPQGQPVPPQAQQAPPIPPQGV